MEWNLGVGRDDDGVGIGNEAVLADAEVEAVADTLEGVEGELFKCEPYHCQLLKSACAERWVRANGAPPSKLDGSKSWANDTLDDAALSVKLRYAHCVGCPVGQVHAEEEPDVGKSKLFCCKCRKTLQRARRDDDFKPYCRSCFSRFVEGPKNGGKARAEKLKKKTSKNASKKKATKKTPKARTKKTTAKPRRRKTADERPVVFLYLEKLGEVDDVRKRHQEEITALLGEIAELEELHPEVKEDAAAMLRRIIGTSNGVTPPWETTPDGHVVTPHPQV